MMKKIIYQKRRMSSTMRGAWINTKSRLAEKYRKTREDFKEMSVSEVCKAFLTLLLRLVTIFYLVAIAVVLPVYFQTATDYNAIGSNKSEFFRKYGFFSIRLFGHIFVFYLIFAAICWWQKNKENKGKLNLLINSFLDSLSVTDKFAIIYAIGLSLSYYYTEYPEALRLGAQGWYMGFLPQLVLVFSYFAISRFLPKILAKWVAGVMLAVSFFVFLLGLLNRYGINPLGMDSAGPGYISTIGNINWYCGYWTVLFPLASGLFLFYEKPKEESGRAFYLRKVLLGILMAAGFATGITQGSDSGLLALLAMLLLLGSLSVSDRRRLKCFLEMLLVFCITAQMLSVIQWLWPDRNQYITKAYSLIMTTAFPWIAGAIVIILYLLLDREEKKTAGLSKKKCPVYRGLRKAWFGILIAMGVTMVSFVVMLTVNTLKPGSIGSFSENPLFIFDENWGSARGGTWTAGIRTWLSQDFLHRIVGAGPDGMAAYIYNGPDEALLETVRSQFGNSRLTNAHGEWITVLANLGVIGLVGFAGMMVSAICRFVRCRTMPQSAIGRGNVKTSIFRTLCVACGVSLFCYTINNIFSFQQTMNVTQMFIVLGIGEGLYRKMPGAETMDF